MVDGVNAAWCGYQYYFRPGIYIYAPEDYRVKRVMEVYGDSLGEAKKNIHRSDEARAAYYKNISGKFWGERQNYDFLIDSSIGIENCVNTICDYVVSRG